MVNPNQLHSLLGVPYFSLLETFRVPAEPTLHVGLKVKHELCALAIEEHVILLVFPIIVRVVHGEVGRILSGLGAMHYFAPAVALRAC